MHHHCVASLVFQLGHLLVGMLECLIGVWVDVEVAGGSGLIFQVFLHHLTFDILVAKVAC